MYEDQKLFGELIKDDSLDMKVDLAALMALTAMFLALLNACRAEEVAMDF